MDDDPPRERRSRGSPNRSLAEPDGKPAGKRRRAEGPNHHGVNPRSVVVDGRSGLVQGRTGMENRIVVPRFGWLSASISPPWASTRRLEIARPSPAPPESADLRKRSNTNGSSSGAMPDPVSATRKAT